MRVRQLAIAALSLSAMVFTAQDCRAATASAPIAVSATVLSVCTIVATTLPFGNYTGSAALTGTATLTVTCTLGSTYNVGLDAGTSAGSTLINRHMASGTSELGYKLTSDAAHTANIGQTAGTDTLSGTGTGTPQLLTVYGLVPSGQNVAAGLYLDTVTATITY